jgi:exonuclease III
LSRIVFWNVNKKDLTSLVCSIAKSTNADVIVLNENKVPREKTLQALQENVSQDFYCPNASPASEKRFHCFCKNLELDLSEIHSGFRTSVRKMNIGQHRVLLALVHGVDIRNYDAETRQGFAQSLASEMQFVKDQQDTTKLILLGDFNMNPYNKGMNLATGLNAMMTKSCVEKGFRRHIGKDYDFYYNPMWSLFGDNTGGPAGTIYNTSSQGDYGWSMLDQVLINHSIVNLFHDVKILTEAGSQLLMDGKGRPNSITASDHFPILVDFCGE